MSFLTAASDRSSRGSGVSGASVASFSGASSFSFSLAAALVLVAMHLSSNAPSWGRRSPTNHPYPMRGESNSRPAPALAVLRPRRQPDSAPEVSSEPLKPRLTLHTREPQGLFPGSIPLRRSPRPLLDTPLHPASFIAIFIAIEPAGRRRLQSPRSAPQFHRAQRAGPSRPATRSNWLRSNPDPRPVRRL